MGGNSHSGWLPELVIRISDYFQWEIAAERFVCSATTIKVGLHGKRPNVKVRRYRSWLK